MGSSVCGQWWCLLVRALSEYLAVQTVGDCFLSHSDRTPVIHVLPRWALNRGTLGHIPSESGQLHRPLEQASPMWMHSAEGGGGYFCIHTSFFSTLFYSGLIGYHISLPFRHIVALKLHLLISYFSHCYY